MRADMLRSNMTIDTTCIRKKKFVSVPAASIGPKICDPLDWFAD